MYEYICDFYLLVSPVVASRPPPHHPHPPASLLHLKDIHPLSGRQGYRDMAGAGTDKNLHCKSLHEYIYIPLQIHMYI